MSGAAWEEAAERMYVPDDDRLKVHPQDDDFQPGEMGFCGNSRGEVSTPAAFHPLNLYRSQVIKQADTVMAVMVLLLRITVSRRSAKKRTSIITIR